MQRERGLRAMAGPPRSLGRHTPRSDLGARCADPVSPFRPCSPGPRVPSRVPTVAGSFGGTGRSTLSRDAERERPWARLRLPDEPTRAARKIDVVDPAQELRAHVGWPLEGPGHPDPPPVRQRICPEQAEWRAVKGCQRQRRNIRKLHLEAAGNADHARDADERDGPRNSVDRVCPGSVDTLVRLISTSRAPPCMLSFYPIDHCSAR